MGFWEPHLIRSKLHRSAAFVEGYLTANKDRSVIAGHLVLSRCGRAAIAGSTLWSVSWPRAFRHPPVRDAVGLCFVSCHARLPLSTRIPAPSLVTTLNIQGRHTDHDAVVSNSQRPWITLNCCFQSNSFPGTLDGSSNRCLARGISLQRASSHWRYAGGYSDSCFTWPA